MPSGELNLSEYRGMWLFAMFDLPVQSKEDRHQYTVFRKELRKLGFSMMQFSVHARYFPTEEASASYRKRVRAALPPDGQVRLLVITDKQFGKMEVFMGKKRTSAEEKPEQMLLL